MPRMLCVANQKGGVGKTTTAINLASGLAMSGNQVLLVDLDPQCNATSGLGCEPAGAHPLLGEDSLRSHVVDTGLEQLEMLPGSRSFRDAELLAQDVGAACHQVVRQFEVGAAEYDFVITDCPPSLGPLTQTALACADEVLMPIQCEYYAMEGLSQMIEVIRDVICHRNNRLEFGGILLTMYDAGLELTREVDQQVREFFGEIVFDTVIPRDVNISEAPSHGQSIMTYSPRSRGCRAYIELCMEVLERD
ncbi:MAG: ParA family protein [Planctomycetota bacterium]|nr:ParA family protein [Planctomycetota bacterium]